LATGSHLQSTNLFTLLYESMRESIAYRIFLKFILGLNCKFFYGDYKYLFEGVKRCRK
jgi:hypothetical protein